MSDEQKGWEIEGVFYPHVGADALLHGDYALIPEVTGLDLDDFLSGSDLMRIETGWIAVAFWRGNPELRRNQVVRIIEHLPGEGAKRVGWAVPEAADASPPAPAEENTTISSSSTTSVEPPEESKSSTDSVLSATESKEDSTLEPSSQNGSGNPTSDTGVTSPLPISDHSASAAG